MSQETRHSECTRVVEKTMDGRELNRREGIIAASGGWQNQEKLFLNIYF